MHCKALAALVTLLLAAPAKSQAQQGEPWGRPLAPSLTAAALLPQRSPLLTTLEIRRLQPSPAQEGPNRSERTFLVTAAVLAGASLGGVWAGAQIPFSPADDDSDLSVWHLLTAPAASVVAVTVASTLLGEDGSSSLRGALLGAGAGIGAALLASMATDDAGILITYAGVHGLVTAWTTR